MHIHTYTHTRKHTFAQTHMQKHTYTYTHINMYAYKHMKTLCAYQPGHCLYLGISRPHENTQTTHIYMSRNWWY